MSLCEVTTFHRTELKERRSYNLAASVVELTAYTKFFDQLLLKVYVTLLFNALTNGTLYR